MRAIVIGASMAGLLCARVLSELFEEVILLDKDTPADDAEPRKGAPQGKHIHVLLAGGTDVIAELFPDIYDEMEPGGARKVDAGNDAVWFNRGTWRARAPTGVVGYVQTRPYLEMHVRRRVAKLANVRQRYGVSATGLSFDAARAVVTGVEIATESGETSTLAADLVIDCSGRGSKSPSWLEKAGYAAPPMTSVGVDLAYATQTFRSARSRERDWMALLIQATPPKGTRDAAAMQIGDDVLQVTLAGHYKDYPPQDPEGFLAFAQGLEHPAIFDVLRNAPPLSEIVTHRFPSSVWRHYERLSRFPHGFLVMGDAMSSISPLYGQGMTVSAHEALALRETLQTTGVGDLARAPLARLFFKRAAKIVDGAWTLAVGADFGFPETQGKRPFGSALTVSYIDRVNTLISRDADALRTWLQVCHLQRPVTDLFRPAIVAGVLREMLAGGAPPATQAVPAAPRPAAAE